MQDWVLEACAELRKIQTEAEVFALACARDNPAAFCSTVLRDEQTGKRVVLSPVQERWHEELSKHDRLVLWSHVEGGKTSQISIGRVLWELGKNPSLRVAIVSNTNNQAKKIVTTLGQYIKKSDMLRAVFPHLQPAKDVSLPWTSTALTVERALLAKDPSVQACGVGGNIMGSRIDLLIFDDILDFENTRSIDQMDRLFAWMRSTPLGRLTAKGRVWAITNAWHPKDPMHRLVAEHRYEGQRFPVVDPVTGELSWPEHWSYERIARQREDLGPVEAARQLDCVARDDATARFKQEWLDTCIARGQGFSLVEQVEQLPAGFAIFTGVDLAVQKHAAADLTAFFTLLLHPDGTRQVLWLEAGRWTGPEIVERIEEHSKRYGGIVVVENNAAQDYILQFARVATRATVRSFTTGRNKANPAFGVESMATELAAGKWIIPSRAGRVTGELAEWVKELLFYSPLEHTGDRLMAAWFAREAIRAFERDVRGKKEGGAGVEVRVIGEPVGPPAEGRKETVGVRVIGGAAAWG
jgi:hypothetical protein